MKKLMKGVSEFLILLNLLTGAFSLLIGFIGWGNGVDWRLTTAGFAELFTALLIAFIAIIKEEGGLH